MNDSDSKVDEEPNVNDEEGALGDEESSEAWDLVEEASNDFEDDASGSGGEDGGDASGETVDDPEETAQTQEGALGDEGDFESDDDDESDGDAGIGLPSPEDTGEPDLEESENDGGAPLEAEDVAIEEDEEEEARSDSESADADASSDLPTPDSADEDDDDEAVGADGDDGGPPSTPPELPERPGDVKGSRETPDEKLTLKSGDTVGGRFIVERYLGSSGGGISYLCREDESGRPVVIKVLAIGSPDDETLERIRNEIRTVSRIRHENLTDILGMGRTEDGQVFVAMNFVQGESLSKAVAQQRERGREIDLAEVFHTLAHLCEGLKAVHQHTTHGVLTPFNVYLVEDGSVQIQNLGFGRVAALYLHSQGEGPFVESIYVAPEVKHDPAHLTPRSDIYSLGMMTAELLSGGGLPREGDHARNVALRLTQEFGDGIHRLIGGTLEEDPNTRITSADEFRMALDNAIEQSDVDLADGVPGDGLPVAPAVEVDVEDDEDDLFDIPGPDREDEAEPDAEEDDDERYLVRKDGLDYGPFTREAVLEQLYDDEIDEHSSVLDRETQDRAELGEMETFREEVEEYIPKREERRRKEAERRAEIERKVKQGGKFTLVVGIIVGLFALGWLSYYYFTRPDPEQLPMEKAFVAMDDYKFLPPPKEFQTVSADEELLEQIFNPEAEEEAIAQRVKEAQDGGGGGQGAGGGGGTAGGGQGSSGGGGAEEEDDDVTTVDMSKGGEDREHLSDKKINDIIMSNFSVLRRCIHKELDNNPSFNGVTVKFYVRPNGSTGGVTLQEKKYLDRPVGRCLVQEFQQMDFPAHSAIDNKGVTFPLRIQR